MFPPEPSSIATLPRTRCTAIGAFAASDCDTVAALGMLQAEDAVWLEPLPDSQQDSATAEASQTIIDLDLTELQAIEPPLRP
jgi:hypothetical protein